MKFLVKRCSYVDVKGDGLMISCANTYALCNVRRYQRNQESMAVNIGWYLSFIPLRNKEVKIPRNIRLLAVILNV